MQQNLKIDSIADFIKSVRTKLNLDKAELGHLINLNGAAVDTITAWEDGEKKPTRSKLKALEELEATLESYRKKAPFAYDESIQPKFKFIDLFAGVGGIRLPFQQLGGKCVFTSEIDKFAQKTYLANFGEMPSGDITKIDELNIPDHDILLAGFPCQAFSQAGLKQGFSDTRGTMFFEIQRILTKKRPKAFLLENVKQLQGHDKGRTLKTILEILRGEHKQEIPQDIPMNDKSRAALEQKLNYWVDVRVLRAGDFGVPQNRERVFIVGFDKDYFGPKVNFEDLYDWPIPPMSPTKVADILEDLSSIPAEEDKFTISDKLWEGHQKRKLEHQNKGNGFGYSLFNADSEYTNTISARYYKDGSEILIDQSNLNKNPRKLTPRECARLQGFPEQFIVDAVSQGQIYKQFGNSVCVKVIEAVAESIFNTITKAESQRALRVLC
ncbi:DNA (cytosine-5-)-methyltransferase [Rheinheimera sp. MMS21-TC3]|uniref:DNA (cytosine-5-)-methyltransferase n=1 Tax=Rheinheimera sp. MMS21-TC3 TaxID=3072790 RepID=UPI0028C46540|nr:DNA (cytosine-5-)-methyltransferase [Rheinheimera sp. MMS21-TC3]WNO60095.1 DNA (cytosine-5-)-methyltransferase [Rheinheimera sp. MMS21-TC3]